MKLSSPIYTLKRRAKLLARSRGLKLHAALNEIALGEGFKDWSHLASCHTQIAPAKKILDQLSPGDMLLIAARPGHGKTLLGLELAALAPRVGRRGYVFTLDFTVTDVWDRLGKLGVPQAQNTCVVDASDDICAEYIVDAVDPVPDTALIVVDYLQLLDQRRHHAPLAEQIETLKHYAQARGAVVVMVSQIDRRFEMSGAGMPDINDVRLPNPVDLSLFDKRCFVHDGHIRLETA